MDAHGTPEEERQDALDCDVFVHDLLPPVAADSAGLPTKAARHLTLCEPCRSKHAAWAAAAKQLSALPPAVAGAGLESFAQVLDASAARHRSEESRPVDGDAGWRRRLQELPRVDAPAGLWRRIHGRLRPAIVLDSAPLRFMRKQGPWVRAAAAVMLAVSATWVVLEVSREPGSTRPGEFTGSWGAPLAGRATEWVQIETDAPHPVADDAWRTAEAGR